MLKTERTYGDLTRFEKLEVDRQIRDHGKKISKEFWQYDHGWDDQRVADNFKIKRQSINSMRCAVFGKLAPKKTSFGLNEDVSITQIRDQLFCLEEKMDSLVDIFS